MTEYATFTRLMLTSIKPRNTFLSRKARAVVEESILDMNFMGTSSVDMSIERNTVGESIWYAVKGCGFVPNIEIY